MDIVHKEDFWVHGVNRQKVADLAEVNFTPQKIIRNSRAALEQLLSCSYSYESKETHTHSLFLTSSSLTMSSPLPEPTQRGKAATAERKENQAFF